MSENDELGKSETLPGAFGGGGVTMAPTRASPAKMRSRQPRHRRLPMSSLSGDNHCQFGDSFVELKGTGYLDL